jgi:hypothetical protein
VIRRTGGGGNSMVLVFAVLGLTASAVVPDVALASCNPGRQAFTLSSQNHTGVITSAGSTPVYVTATIQEYSPYVQAGPDAAYSMLQLSPNNKWAQIGWWGNVGFPRQMFVQYTNDSGSPPWTTHVYSAKALGTYTKYEVRRIVGGFSFLAAGTTVITVTDATFVPSQAVFSGETSNNDDQVPGSVGSRLQIYNVMISHDLRTWTDVTNAPFGNQSYDGFEKLSSGSYRIWDKGCP